MTPESEIDRVFVMYGVNITLDEAKKLYPAKPIDPTKPAPVEKDDEK